MLLNNLSMLFIIINYSDEKNFLKIINKYKIGFKYVVQGKGTASSSLLEYFGLNEEDKKIMTMVLPTPVCRCLLKDIGDKANVNAHGKGISFSVPLSSATKYMTDFYKKYEMEEFDMGDINQHLIVTIVNSGAAEKVMSVAKKAGSTGGTTISGRGLENEKAVKFLKISIEPEKDIVLILSKSEKKNDIMNAIIASCGLKTSFGGICFSLPVDSVVGLKFD